MYKVWKYCPTNYFLSLKIYNQALKIYFQAVKIYFHALKISFSLAEKGLFQRLSEFVSSPLGGSYQKRK